MAPDDLVRPPSLDQLRKVDSIECDCKKGRCALCFETGTREGYILLSKRFELDFSTILRFRKVRIGSDERQEAKGSECPP
jgi:hypothetical protein